jgi:hypothetical protein
MAGRPPRQSDGAGRARRRLAGRALLAVRSPGQARQDRIDAANGYPRAPGCEPAGSGLHGSTPRCDGSVGRAGPFGHSGFRLGHPSRLLCRGYRAIVRRRRRGRSRRRPAAPLVGRCVVWVQLQRSAARSARLSSRAAGPGDLLQRRFLRGGSSPTQISRPTDLSSCPLKI